jgi:hypothetical protein
LDLLGGVATAPAKTSAQTQAVLTAMAQSSEHTQSMLEQILKRLDDQAAVGTQRHEAQAAFNTQVSHELQGVRKQLEITQADVDEARQAVFPSGSSAPISEQRNTALAPSPRAAAAAVPTTQGHARLANDGPPLLSEVPAVKLAAPARVRQHATDDEREQFVKPPKHDFPRFDGSLPNLWLDRCLSYFELYHTAPANWVTTASLYLDGRAALWWQAFRQTRRVMAWETFGQALQEEFGPDEFEVQMHQPSDFFCC